MVHWLWIVAAIIVSGSIGYLIGAAFRAGIREDQFTEVASAYHDGFKAGLAEFKKVG